MNHNKTIPNRTIEIIIYILKTIPAPGFSFSKGHFLHS